MESKISVIIPAFNRGHIIGETLNSVLDQSYSNWECLIVDDGSTDNTEKIVRSYMEEDTRIKFFIRPTKRAKGATTCRNIGIEESTGEYFQFLDSDDLLSKNKFEIQLKELKSGSKTAICTCKWGTARVNSREAKIYHGLSTYFSTRSPIDLIATYGKRLTYFPPHVFLVPKAVLLESGKWNEELNNNVNDDGEFFSRIILASSEIIYCKDTYVLYRTGAGGRLTSSKKAEEKRLGYMKSLELIENNIRRSIGTSNHIYIEQRKAELYYRLKKENPALVEKNQDFFLGKSSRLKYYFLRLLSGLKNKLSRRVEVIKLSSASE